jgi:leucyl aminopeptidase (aminopeptidase T)
VRRSPEIRLSPEERGELERYRRGKSARDPLALRSRIVLEAAKGFTNLEVARRLRVDRLTVARWRQRFLAGRLRALRRASAPSVRAPRISDEVVRKVVRSALAGPGLDSVPSLRAVARRLGVSHTSVARIWREYQYQRGSVRTASVRADPAAPLAPAEVVGVYLHPPCMALATLLAPRPLPRKEPPGIPDPTRSSGTRVVRELTGLTQFLGDLPDRGDRSPGNARRNAELIRFLAAVRGETGPDSDVRVLLTGTGRRVALELDRWAIRWPRFRIEQITDPVEWRRRAILDIATAAEHPRGRGLRSGRLASSRSLSQTLDQYPSGNAPFEWVATREEVRRGRASRDLRYELASTGHPVLGRDLAPPAQTQVSDRDTDRGVARNVLRKCLRVRRGESVLIQSWTTTRTLADAFVLESRKLGAIPMHLHEDEGTYWSSAMECRPADLSRIGAPLRAAIERADALVVFFGPSDRARHHALWPELRSRLGEYQDAFYRAAERARCRAVVMAVGRASEASARFYGVDLSRWRSELVDGALRSPALLRRRAQRALRLLRSGRSVRITHPNGTDLRLGLKHRAPMLSDGAVAPTRSTVSWDVVTLPAGVVTVALDETVADGTFRSNVASAAAISGEVGDYAGGRWTFRRGRLVDHRYDRGGAAFDESYHRAGPGRDRPGTLAIGLNDGLEISPLLEDQGWGTVTLQVGRNEHVGGSNRASWWGWLFLRGADVTIDGVPVVRAGRLLG